MKYLLTNAELRLVTDPEVLLSKNRIITKVYEMFGSLSDGYKEQATCLREELKNAKISKGENYSGLPYVMLDYPREFNKVDVLAVRTFFWWGNFFSITLQLAGAYQDKHAAELQASIDKGLLDEWFITLSDNAWLHHFDGGYYEKIKTGEDYKLKDLPFVKVSTKIGLKEWKQAEDFLYKNFALLMNILQ